MARNPFVLFVRAFLASLGTAIAMGIAFADRWGVTEAGLWQRRPVLIAALGLSALVLLFFSMALGWNLWSSWFAHHAATVAIGCVWVTILAMGLAGAELYARRKEGYLLWRFSLKKSNFFEPDHLKTYNRRFYQERQAAFHSWPIPLELFDSDQPTPRYLFKPNLRMARQGDRLVAAQPDEEAYWSSNSWGFRGPEFSIRKQPGVVRIVCLGASTTEGSQRDRETYPYFLQEELRRMFPERAIEVINAGHHGHGVEDLLAILKHRVLPLSPDVVIFYEASNNIDVQDFASKWTDFTGGKSAVVRWKLKLWRWLRSHSAYFVWVSNSLAWTTHLPHEFTNARPKPSADHYESVLRQMVRETKRRGSTIVLSSFITLAHEGLEVSPKQNPLLFRDLYRHYEPLSPGEIAQAYEHFNARSARVARECGVHYADVAAAFPKDLRYFPFDLIHFSPEGNRLLARLFASFLERNVLRGSEGHARVRKRPARNTLLTSARGCSE